MSGSDSRCFRARPSEFDAIRAYLAEAGQRLGQGVLQRLELIVEELFCNSMEHGYGGESDRPVWIGLRCEGAACRITYEDCAPAYDPFSLPRHTLLEAAPEERPVGGLGVFLLVALSTAHRYERRGDRNVVEVEVPCGDAAAAG